MKRQDSSKQKIILSIVFDLSMIHLLINRSTTTLERTNVCIGRYRSKNATTNLEIAMETMGHRFRVEEINKFPFAARNSR